MTYRAVALFAVVTFLPTSVVVQTQRAGRPNIIYIMTDDHAAHAIGAYGSRINQTPHLDRLAREGALLTSVFATNAICTPSRAAILTGQYSRINGVTMFNRFDSSAAARPSCAPRLVPRLAGTGDRMKPPGFLACDRVVRGDEPADAVLAATRRASS